MRTIQLNISRDKAYVAAAMGYRILIDNQEVGKIKIGQTMTLNIPDKPTSLKVSMVGNAMNIHRMEKEVVLFPEKSSSGIVECSINTKPNWLGILTSGFIQAVGQINLTINYK